jgi:hypothetical protein
MCYPEDRISPKQVVLRGRQMGVGLDSQDGRVSQCGLVDELHGVENHHEGKKVPVDLAK